MKKRILAFLAAVLIFVSVPVSASAHEVPDPERKGSVTVTFKYDGKPVSGGTLTIYKVGEVSVNEGNYGFVFTGDFAGCPVPIENINSSELPEALAKIAREKRIEGIIEKIDKDGKVRFEKLEHGLYLAVQHRFSPGFDEISPFLISVPYYDGEHYIYDVDASPKVELEPDPYEPERPEEPDEPDKPDGELPDTGLTSWPVPVMAVSGAVLICVGIILRRAERKTR